MEKCPHFLENHPGSCLMLGKKHLESCLISGICVPSCCCIWLSSLSCWTPPEMEYWACWTICMLCYLTAKQFKGRNMIVFWDGESELLGLCFSGICVNSVWAAWGGEDSDYSVWKGELHWAGMAPQNSENENSGLSVGIQGPHLCNVFMFTSIPGSWGEARIVFVFPRLNSASRRKGSVPFSTSKLVFCGHRAAHRKFIFTETAPWDFPALPAWPLLPPCSALASSMSLVCKIVGFFLLGFISLLNNLKKLEDEGKIRPISNWWSDLNEWMKLWSKHCFFSLSLLFCRKWY